MHSGSPHHFWCLLANLCVICMVPMSQVGTLTCMLKMEPSLALFTPLRGTESSQALAWMESALSNITAVVAIEKWVGICQKREDQTSSIHTVDCILLTKQLWDRADFYFLWEKSSIWRRMVHPSPAWEQTGCRCTLALLSGKHCHGQGHGRWRSGVHERTPPHWTWMQ